MKLQKIAAIISAAALALALTGCGKEPASGTTLNPFENKPNVQLPDIPVNEASAFEYKYDSELGGMVITDYKMQSPKIHIPDKLENEKVVKVDFGGVEKDITHIIMPDSVKEFGLSDQIKEVLQFINIPASVTKLEPQELDDQFHSIGCFDGYSSLTSIAIPNSVTEIGKDAFNHCTSLTSVNIPGSVTTIGKSAFNDCTSLTSITIPNSVTEMGDGVFAFCTSLTSVTIPDGVTQIGDTAFEGCTSLESVIIPGSLTGGIGYSAFKDCPNIKATYKGETYDYKRIDTLYTVINRQRKPQAAP